MKLTNALIVLAAMLFTGVASAQDYPTKPVRILVPAAVGGNPDFVGRSLADKLTTAFGGRHAFFVENAPGAGGLLAAEQLSKVAADPHHLMLGESGAMGIAVTLTPTKSFDPLKDFTPITALASVSVVLGVHPDVKASNLQEFIAAAKAKPGALNFGSIGAGSFHHLTMELLIARADIKMTHIAYRSGADLVRALLAGEIQAGWAGIPNLQQAVGNGTLKAVAISTRDRSKTMPTVATVAEQGFPGFAMATTMGLVAPKGISPAIVARLQAAAAKALREPDVAARMEQLSMNLEENGTAHYQQFLRDDIQRFAEAIKAAGIKPEQ
jgi:tripartite-type tricarboxylate transporter receptor subunit TctC